MANYQSGAYGPPQPQQPPPSAYMSTQNTSVPAGYGSGYFPPTTQTNQAAQAYGSNFAQAPTVNFNAPMGQSSQAYGTGFPQHPAPSQAYGTGYPQNPAPSQAYGTGYPQNPAPSQSYGTGYPQNPAPSQAYGTGYPQNPAPSQAYGTGYPAPSQAYGSGYPAPSQAYGTGYPAQQNPAPPTQYASQKGTQSNYPPQNYNSGFPPSQQYNNSYSAPQAYPTQNYQTNQMPQQYQSNQMPQQYHNAQTSQQSSSQHLQLTCAAKSLDNKDGMFGKSDPFVEIRNAKNQLVAKSEMIKNNLNPNWKPFTVDIAACGGISAPIVVHVVDFDDDGRHDLIGTIATTLSELQAKIGTYIPLKPVKAGFFKKTSGQFVVKQAQLVSVQVAPAYNITFSCKKLANKDGIFGKSDPFIVIYAVPPGGSGSTKKHDMVVVARTEMIKNNLNPTFKPMLIETAACGGMEAVLVAKIYDWDSDLRHDYIGEFNCNLRSLLAPSPQYPVANPKRSGKNFGMCYVIAATAAQPDPVINSNRPWKFTIKCARLKSMDTFSKSDPYMLVKSASGHVYYRSESYHNNSHPRFKPFTLTPEQVGGLDRRIVIEIWDKDLVNDDFNGAIFTSLRELLMYRINNRWVLRNNRKPKENHGRKVGEIQVLSVT